MISIRKTIIKEIIYSLAYNLLFFAGYYLVMLFFREYSMVISILFITSYLFLLIPMRDYIYSRLFFRKSPIRDASWNSIENRIHQIVDYGDIFQFLTDFIRETRISGLRVVLYKPYARVMYYNSMGRRKWISVRKPEPDGLLEFFRKNPSIHRFEDFPEIFRNYFSRIKVKTIFPIMIRNHIVGSIGIADILSEHTTGITEKFARRLALVTENEQLKKEISQGQFLEKEFTLARKVEALLERKEDVNRCGYIVSKIDKGWKQKYFPALFEVNQNVYTDNFFSTEKEGQRNPECPYFIIIARLSELSHSSRTMQLFSVQGYFLSIAKSSRNITVLSSRLNESLVGLENGKIQLDGFLMQFYQKGIWDILPFGKNLGLFQENIWKKIPRTPALGSPEFRTPSPLSISHPDLLQLSISGYPLLWIGKEIK